jgi:sugar O-acyltransferase (sialic acid O-acetyltransferase NeuD family)
MSNPTFVPIPKESVSDDTVLLSRWLVGNRAPVQRGAVIAVVETSKSAIDIESPGDGFLHHLVSEGDRVAVGANFAAICLTSEPQAQVSLPVASEVRDGGARFSKAAWQLAQEHHLDLASFVHLPLVRREDVEAQLRLAKVGSASLLPAMPAPRSTDVVIWGGGGHGKVCIEIIRAAGTHTIYGIVDARAAAVGTTVLGVPVIGHESALEALRLRGVSAAVLGIGAVLAHGSRPEKFERLRQAGFALPTLVHPRAAVDPSATLGEGSVVFAHATISADVRVGRGCIVNSGAVISHDCELGDNVHLAPGALLAGGVNIGSDTLIGMGAKIFVGVRIGRGVRVNNGVVLNGDVPDAAVVKG